MNVSFLIILPLMLLFAIGLPALIGVYVYRDARERGMDAVLWTLVAVMAPSLIGLIVYLAVRGKYTCQRCPACSARVEADYVRCPQCGQELKNLCPACGQPVEHTWKVCPRCGSPLPEDMQPVARQGAGRKLPAWLLVIVIAVPLLLLCAVASYAVVARSTASAVSEAAPRVSGESAPAYDFKEQSLLLPEGSPARPGLERGEAEAARPQTL